MIGPHPHESDAQRLNLVDLNENNQEIVSGIFFNMPQINHRAISYIGVTCKPFKGIIRSCAPSFRYNVPQSLRQFGWFLSHAALVDVSFVRLCRDDRKRDGPCIGMLLNYRDGSREALGQWRWSASIETIILDDKQKIMYYKLEHDSIMAIEFSREPTTTGVYDDTWNRGKLLGELVWWFNEDSNSMLEFRN